MSCSQFSFKPLRRKWTQYFLALSSDSDLKDCGGDEGGMCYSTIATKSLGGNHTRGPSACLRKREANQLFEDGLMSLHWQNGGKAIFSAHFLPLNGDNTGPVLLPVAHLLSDRERKRMAQKVVNDRKMGSCALNGQIGCHKNVQNDVHKKEEIVSNRMKTFQKQTSQVRQKNCKMCSAESLSISSFPLSGKVPSAGRGLWALVSSRLGANPLSHLPCGSWSPGLCWL